MRPAALRTWPLFAALAGAGLVPLAAAAAAPEATPGHVATRADQEPGRAADIGRRMDDLQREDLIGWTLHFAERPRPVAAAPDVLALSDTAFAREVCRDEAFPCDNVLAAFDAARNRVVYRTSLDLGKVWERSFLVHELVHWIQHHAPATAPAAASQATSNREECEAYRAAEREAYTVQNRYLRHHQSGRRAGGALPMLFCR